MNNKYKLVPTWTIIIYRNAYRHIYHLLLSQYVQENKAPSSREESASIGGSGVFFAVAQFSADVS